MISSHKKSIEENGSKTVLPQKIIANMREATGASDEDIKTMLQICNGDANLATERLLENPFAKVVSKKDKRKQKEDEKRRDREASKRDMDARQQTSERRNRIDRPSGRGYSAAKPGGRPVAPRVDASPAPLAQGSGSAGFGWDAASKPSEIWPKAAETWNSGGVDSNASQSLTTLASDSAMSSLPIKATPGMKMADLFKGQPAVEPPPPAAPAPDLEYATPEPAASEEEPPQDPESPASPEPNATDFAPTEAPIPESAAAPPAAPQAWGVIPETPVPEPTPPMPTFKNLVPPPAPEPPKDTLAYPPSHPSDHLASVADALPLSFGNFNLGGRSATDGLPGFKPTPAQAIPTPAPIPVPSHSTHSNIVGEPVPISAPLSTDIEAYTTAASSFGYNLGATQQPASSLDKIQASTTSSYTHPLQHLPTGAGAMQQHFQSLASSRVGGGAHAQPSPPTTASNASSLGVKFGSGFGADKVEPVPPPPAAGSGYPRGFGSGFGPDTAAAVPYTTATASDFGIGTDPKPGVSAPSQLSNSMATSMGNSAATAANPSNMQPLLSAMGYGQLPAVEASANAATSQGVAAVGQAPLSQQANTYTSAQTPPGMQYPNYYPNYYPPNMYSYAHYSQGGYPQQTSTSYPQAAGSYNAQGGLGVGTHRNFSASAAAFTPAGTAAPSYPTTQSTYEDNSFSNRDRDVAPGYSTGTPLNAAAAAFPPQQLRGGPYFQGTGGYLQQPYAQQYYGGHNQYSQFPSQQSLGGSNQPGSGLKLS